MTDHEPMSDALVERVARAIAGELGKQDFGEPFELKADLKLAYLDQGEVDFTLVARAAIEASGITALTDRVEQLREALEAGTLSMTNTQVLIDFETRAEADLMYEQLALVIIDRRPSPHHMER